MAHFRLLHASDFHFARVARQIGLPDTRYAWANQVSGTWATVSSHNDLYADAFAAYVYANQAGIDALVLSGDLATTGDPGDLRKARQFVAAPVGLGYLSARNSPTLQAARKPILLLPGNHDRFGRFHSPGRASFDSVFGNYWRARQGAQFLWAKPRDNDWLVLLGADFTLRKSDAGSLFCGVPLLGFLGQGRTYPRRLQALQQLTRQTRKKYPEAVILWVIHFEPSAADGSLALLDDHHLTAALSQDRVDAILCGHTHDSNVKKVFAGTPVFVSGTTTQHASVSGNSFHILDIDVSPPGAPKFSCTVVRYDAGSGHFK